MAVLPRIKKFILEGSKDPIAATIFTYLHVVDIRPLNHAQ